MHGLAAGVAFRQSLARSEEHLCVSQRGRRRRAELIKGDHTQRICSRGVALGAQRDALRAVVDLHRVEPAVLEHAQLGLAWHVENGGVGEQALKQLHGIFMGADSQRHLLSGSANVFERRET